MAFFKMIRFKLIVGFAFAIALAVQGQSAKVSIANIESLIRSQQYDQALSSLKVALRSNSGDFKLWTLQGICLGLQGNDVQAVAAFDHALRISPNYTPALQ